jgi:D-glycero-alpha-D-manno-heptose 1-phosphate guanylyltransferase
MTQTCIVLAGGLGSRLANEVPYLPKCLAPINGEPFLKLQLEMLCQSGLEDFVLALGHKAEHVISEIKNTWAKNYNISYVVEQTPLGTGGAIKHVFDKYRLDESVVVNGDTILEGNFSGMLRPLNISDGEKVRVVGVEVQNRVQFGGFVIDRKNRIKRFIEKGCIGPGIINAGIYRMNKSIFNEIDKSFSLETQIFPKLVNGKHLYVYIVKGNFFDIGTPKDYQFFSSKKAQFR